MVYTRVYHSRLWQNLLKCGLTAALFHHNFVVLFYRTVSVHSIGVVSHLNAVLLKHNRGRFRSKIVKIGIYWRFRKNIRGPYFQNMVHTCWFAGKTARSLDNRHHSWAVLRWRSMANISSLSHSPPQPPQFVLGFAALSSSKDENLWMNYHTTGWHTYDCTHKTKQRSPW